MMDKMTRAANYSDGTLVELALQMMINQDRVKRGLNLMEGTEPNSKILDEIKDYINTDGVYELFEGVVAFEKVFEKTKTITNRIVYFECCHIL